METLQKYPIYIKKKPSAKFKSVEALLRIYIRRSIVTNGVNPDWPLLFMRNKDDKLPSETLKATQAMVLKHKEIFVSILIPIPLAPDNNTAA